MCHRIFSNILLWVGLPTELMHTTAWELVELICARVKGIEMGTKMTEFFRTKVIKTQGQVVQILESNIAHWGSHLIENAGNKITKNISF